MNKAIGNVMWRRVLVTALLSILLSCGYSEAAQQYQGLCSYVRIEILQTLTTERVGFLATLKVTNNEGDASITGFSANLSFSNPQQDAQGNLVDASAMFFVKPPDIKGVTGIDGTGIIPPGQTAEVSWFIIPKVTAGGTDPSGLLYNVGANLAGLLYGQEIPAGVLTVLPELITVRPDPQLEITYFQPRDVDGDDPFTLDIVESPIPFTLGVLVKNSGFGKARNIRIESEQPRIVENKQGLLVVPRLLGSRVDDKPTDYGSLTVDIGDLEPGNCRKAAWDMITTLSGEFTAFKASFSHALELGGRDTSLIKSTNAYFIVHEVLNDQPGRDGLLDFLAATQNPAEMVPDTLYESDCNTLQVNRLMDASVASYNGVTATVSANATFENWVFLRLDDPAQAKLKIAKVVRSDGKVLSPHNYWTNVRYSPITKERLAYLNIFDFVSLGQYSYTVSYEATGTDTTAPVTQLLFSGAHQEVGGNHNMLPQTQIYFIATDESPVGTYYRLDGGLPSENFLPAYPFSISAPGQHRLEYYSRDSAGNQETTKTATLVVASGVPSIDSLTVSNNELYVPGNSVSVRPQQVSVDITSSSSAGSVSVEADVFQGAYAWPVLSGIPSTPTALTVASITVGGSNLDFYQYRLGTGAWSVEVPRSQPISLAGLSGAVQLSVRGRSKNGSYLPDDQAVTVGWQVAAGVPLALSGTPETPTWGSGAQLRVSGSDYFCYRVDGGLFRPNLAAKEVIVLGSLLAGDHSVEVFPRTGAADSCPVSGPTVAATWKIDRDHGLRLPDASLVRHESLGTASGPVHFTWDGRDAEGRVVQTGWYSVRILVKDGLGQTTGQVKQVYVGDLIPDGGAVPGAGDALQTEAHAFGKWLVWQDQRQGNWDIYALKLGDPQGGAEVVADGPLNQTRPRTDGTYVVWEDRQDDGSFDIWCRELGSGKPAFAVTATPGFDEIRPFVHYPYIVYQKKAVSAPGAPWQIYAYNMIDKSERGVDPSSQDQLDPAVHRQKVVWQDFRDVGYGEIYLKNLWENRVQRITNSPAGQYHPSIYDDWVVWEDNRDTQIDLYGLDLRRGAETRLTITPENETRASLNGEWVVYQADSGGVLVSNLRLLHLANLKSVQLTNVPSVKDKPSLASGKLAWTDSRSGRAQVLTGSIPDLQPVFRNANAVAVTQGTVASQPDAYALLTLWQREAGVTSLTRYSSLVPGPVAETVTWQGGAPAGPNFALQAGSFVWVEFGNGRILDLGPASCGVVSLPAGTSALAYSCFPDNYSAYRLIRELGTDKVKAVRLLDSQNGVWLVARVVDGRLQGEDFRVPKLGVVFIEMGSAVPSWVPGS